MSARHVPFSLVAAVLFILILAVLVFYVYRNETLLIVALLLLVILVVSLRVIQAVNLFRPRRHRCTTVIPTIVLYTDMSGALHNLETPKRLAAKILVHPFATSRTENESSERIK